MRLLKRAASFVLAAVITVSTICSASAAIYGTQLHQTGISLSGGTALASGVYFSSGSSARQSESYIEYTPGGSVVPIVAYGKQLYGRASLDYVTDYLEEKDVEVVAGINADFFELSSGVSQGVVIVDGKVKASDNSKYAVGFFKDGSVTIGTPSIEVVALVAGTEFVGLHINKELTVSMGFGLYTRDYAETTMASIPSINVVIEANTTDFEIGSVITGTVRSVNNAADAFSIPDGCIVMTIASESAYATALESIKKIQAGDSVTITVGGNSAWRDVAYGVGGGSMLVSGSAAQTQDSSSVSKDITARSAVGVKSDGSVIFYTVDGKQEDISKGITLTELAERMVELGCVTALNLDGGGSTTIAAKFPGDEELTTVNSPSDGSQRKCANFIFLVNTASKTGIANRLILYPYSALVLKGSSLTYEVKAVDTSWYSCDLPNSRVGYSSTLGTFAEGGVFTALNTGNGQVFATLDGGVDGQTDVRVIDNPSTLSILYEEAAYDITGKTIGVAPGAELDLAANVTYEGLDVVSSDSAFTWEVSGQAGGSIGVVDENGIFTANAVSAGVEGELTGTVTASYGTLSASVNITISPSAVEGYAIEGFESGSALPVSSSDAMNVSRETNIENVRYGKASLRLDYDLTLASSETPPTASYSLPISAEMTHLGMWVYGDSSNNKLAVIVDQSTLEVAALNFTGWQYFTVAIPAASNELKAYAILTGDGSATSGSILIDQIIEAKGPIYDVTPPVVTAVAEASPENTSSEASESAQSPSMRLVATIKDNGITTITDEFIMLTYDGTPISFTLNGSNLSANLPAADGNTHIATLLVTDSVGNLTRYPVTIEGSGTNQPFADMSGHWAGTYTSYMYRRGIISGMTQNNALVYKPDTQMTRAQFAVVMANWLGLDLEAYADVELPFTDNASIPYWAESAVKAVYSLGIVKGSMSGDALKFNPDSSLTRAEAMTIIGRTQVKGFAEGSLNEFNDAASVPSWAAGFIKTLAAQGVVSGSNGNILPSSPVTRAQVAKMLFTLM